MSTVYLAVESAAIVQIKAIYRGRNCFIPLHQFPIEVLMKIIHFSLDTEVDYYDDLTSRRLICSYWKEIIDVHPRFWSVLHNDMTHSQVRMCLGRSEAAPLAVYYVREDTMSEQDVTFILATTLHVDRWEIHKIVVNTFGGARWPYLEQAAPRLRELCITVGASPHEPWQAPTNLFSGEAPFLQDVELRGFPIFWNTGVLNSLHSLALSNIGEPGPTVQELVDILVASPALKTLKLQSLSFHDTPGKPWTTHVTGIPLPDLTTLHIEGVAPVVAAYLLGSLDVPERASLSLEADFKYTPTIPDPDYPSDAETNFFNTCGGSIRHFFLNVMSSDGCQPLEINISYTSLSITTGDDKVKCSIVGLDNGYACLLGMLRVMGHTAFDGFSVRLYLRDFRNKSELARAAPVSMAGGVNVDLIEISTIVERLLEMEPYLQSVISVALRGLHGGMEVELSRHPWRVDEILQMLGQLAPRNGGEEATTAKTTDRTRLLFPELRTVSVLGCKCTSVVLWRMLTARFTGVTETLTEDGDTNVMLSRPHGSWAPETRLVRLYLAGGKFDENVQGDLDSMMRDWKGRFFYQKIWRLMDKDMEHDASTDVSEETSEEDEDEEGENEEEENEELGRQSERGREYVGSDWSE